MTKYILRRLVLVVISLLAIYTITFVLMHATPGGPWDQGDKPLSPQVIAAIKAKYGLDQPLWKQYVSYLWGIIRHADFGPSYTSRTGTTVSEIIGQFWPVSIQLGLVAMVLSLLVGVPLGVVAALKHNTAVDFLATFVSIVGVSAPSFVVVSLMILVFSLRLHWVPTGGWEGVFSRTIFIPAAALALGPAATLARYTRASMLEVIRMDYVRTARSKGLSERAVIFRHALRNALIPVVTVAGLSLAGVLTGSFFVESIYRVPGIGRYFVTSVQGRDYPVMIGVTLLWGTMLSVMNLAVDVAYGLLDPRIRYE